MTNVSPDALARLASMKKPDAPGGGASGWTYDARAMREANDADLEVLGIQPTGKTKARPDGGYLWELSGCPYSQDHGDSAFRIQYADGGIHVGCHHDRCQGRTITSEPARFPRTLAVTGTPPPVTGGITFGGKPLGGNRTPGEPAGAEGSDTHAGDPGDAPARVPVLLPLEDVEEKAIDWIWHGWLAHGMLAILGGYGGDGKSTLTMDLVARLTRKASILPDGRPAPHVNVLILAAEDDPSYAIKPRLRLHGADMSRVFILKGIRESNGAMAWFNLAQDVEAMRDVIAAYDIGFVVIDPLSSYMPKADRNSEGDVRDALMPLQVLMEDTGVAVLGIMHVGKAEGQRQAAQRLLGSTAFTALARCVWMVHELPEEHQPEQTHETSGTIGRRKVLGVVKANYSLKPPAQAWSQPLDGPVTWHGPSPVDIEAAFAADGKRSAPKQEEAETFLREFLRSGSQPAARVLATAKDREPSIGERTLRTAAERIGVEKIKDGFQGVSLWSLPRNPGAFEAPESPKDGKRGYPDGIEDPAKIGEDDDSKRGTFPVHGTTARFATFEEPHSQQPTGTNGASDRRVKV